MRLLNEAVEDPSRRRLLKSAALAAAALSLPACGAKPTPGDRALVFPKLIDAMSELEALAAAPMLESSTLWTWPQTLVHCAQSIEYSMAGFPRSRTATFQHTVGTAAFRVFSWRGYMSHDLEESIPGAPGIEASVSKIDAENRLRLAIENFFNYRGELRPHFAYGELSYDEYVQAHAMHLANHFSAFAVKA